MMNIINTKFDPHMNSNKGQELWFSGGKYENLRVFSALIIIIFINCKWVDTRWQWLGTRWQWRIHIVLSVAGVILFF
jgi:hypothetical protein